MCSRNGTEWNGIDMAIMDIISRLMNVKSMPFLLHSVLFLLSAVAFGGLNCQKKKCLHLIAFETANKELCRNFVCKLN